MKLSMMAMAANRLAKFLEPEIKMEIVYEIRDEHGGSSQPEHSGTILRIPAIAALEPLYRN